MLGHEVRVNALIGTGHFLSHFYTLCLPPLFFAWQREFGVSFAELGLSATAMAAVTALLQTPVGFLVDRHGARRFLVGGTLLMTLTISMMGFATSYWQILLLATLSGIGNSVVHPADYAILTGSIAPERIGRCFGLHTCNGNLGMAMAPPAIILLAGALGWRGALVVVGLLGLPLVAAILWQSRILIDQARPKQAAAPVSARELLFGQTMLLFFGFFLLGAMAGAGVQAWAITVLHQTRGMDLALASVALTAYTAGATIGTLAGGYAAEHIRRLLTFAAVLTALSAALILVLATWVLPDAVILGLLLLSGLSLGASRTPRDMMVKDAAPPGQIGKVFGFVSSGLPLGGALAPAPLGLLIDHGRPDLVFVAVAVLLAASILCAGSARGSALTHVAPGRETS